LRVAREALALGRASFPKFSHRNSPKTYTQPQLFACLVLKSFLRTDYRGICAHLQDLADLRVVLGLKHVPHFTTLQKASRRLLRIANARRLIRRTVRRFQCRRRKVKRAALDSTGFQCGHASTYYTRRRAGLNKTRVKYSRFAKLEAAVDCATHLVLGVLVGRGPRVDVDRFVPLLNEALDCTLLDSVLADAGFDSEPNHRHARDHCGVRSFIPATHGRPTDKLPVGRYRRRMKQRLNKDYGRYGQRWQAETAFSMIKRRLNSHVAARQYWSQCRELMLLVVSHNIMILYASRSFLQSMSGIFVRIYLARRQHRTNSEEKDS
jgi:hypothetical protein